MEKASFFWYNYLGNELLYPSVPNKETLNDSIKEPEPPKEKITLKRKINNRPSSRRTKTMLDPVYLCGECNCDIVFFTENFEENSIECENCNRWYHFRLIALLW